MKKKDLGTPESIAKKLLNPYMLRIDYFLDAGILNSDQHHAGLRLTLWHDAFARRYGVRTSNYDSDRVGGGSAEDGLVDIITAADKYSKTMNEMKKNHDGAGAVVLAIIVDQLSVDQMVARLRCRRNTAKKRIRDAFDSLIESIEEVGV